MILYQYLFRLHSMNRCYDLFCLWFFRQKLGCRYYRLKDFGNIFEINVFYELFVNIINVSSIPYFVNNPKKTSKITLVNEKGNTLSEDEKIAETFNKFFGNIIKNVNIKNEVLKVLNTKKAKQENDISIKLTKENIELFSTVLCRMFNFYIDKTSFPAYADHYLQI